MPAKYALEAAQLFHACDPGSLGIDSTADIEVREGVVGQARALDAVHFGTRMGGDGYNVFVLGPPGTGRFEAVVHILGEESRRRPPPADWCYVDNFDEPHKPKALSMPPGRAGQLREDMVQLTEDLGTAIPASFETEEYHARVEKLDQELAERRNAAFNELAEEATKRRVQLLHTPQGFAFAPLDDKDEVITPEHFEQLESEQKQRIQQTVEDLQKKLQRVVRQFPAWQKETREKIRELDREIAHYAVGHLIDVLQENYADLPDVVAHLEAIEHDLVEHVHEFRDEQTGPLSMMLQGGAGRASVLQRYGINVLVDHGGDECAPVVHQDLPSYGNLIGRVEYRAQMGTLVTDFTLIKPGDLHRANGGYLVLDARQVLMQPFAWEALKRALRTREIRVEPLERTYGLLRTLSLEPEHIPLDVKVVLIGDHLLYYLLYEFDPDFRELFKVAADFEQTVDRGDQATAYVGMLTRMIREHELRAFDSAALARVIEYSTRLAGDRDKLSAHLRALSDLLREADYWAAQESRSTVTRDDVQRAIDAQIHRADRVRERIYEAIQKGTIRIDTDGERSGQVNALSVLDLGNFSFGQPTRITATARLGEGEVIDIERETELGGSIHSKGVLILSNFLASRYAQGYPLSLTGSLVFEQSYATVEGDSASLAELCALLSALAELPVRQALALTGSVNQLGQVQAIGGVNEKVEGFFDVCNARGLTGRQGVVIPRTNVRHLMLRGDVVQAVQEGRFAVYAVDTVDEALEVLTGVDAGKRGDDGRFPPDSVNGRVEARLVHLAHRRRRYSRESGNGTAENGEIDEPEDSG